MKNSGIQGYVLDSEYRTKLLAAFSPVFPEIKAHHVTYQFGRELDNSVDPIAMLRVVGFARNDKIQAVVVEVNGSVIRNDGKLFHITISLDRDAGAKPMHSNDLVMAGYQPYTGPVVMLAGQYGFV